jgi:hypothetical protein
MMLSNNCLISLRSLLNQHSEDDLCRSGRSYNDNDEFPVHVVSEEEKREWIEELDNEDLQDQLNNLSYSTKKEEELFFVVHQRYYSEDELFDKDDFPVFTKEEDPHELPVSLNEGGNEQQENEEFSVHIVDPNEFSASELEFSVHHADQQEQFSVHCADQQEQFPVHHAVIPPSQLKHTPKQTKKPTQTKPSQSRQVPPTRLNKPKQTYKPHTQTKPLPSKQTLKQPILTKPSQPKQTHKQPTLTKTLQPKQTLTRQKPQTKGKQTQPKPLIQKPRWR